MHPQGLDGPGVEQSTEGSWKPSSFGEGVRGVGRIWACCGSLLARIETNREILQKHQLWDCSFNPRGSDKGLVG